MMRLLLVCCALFASSQYKFAVYGTSPHQLKLYALYCCTVQLCMPSLPQFASAQEASHTIRKDLLELKKMTARLTSIADEIVRSIPPRSKDIDHESTETVIPEAVITSPVLEVRWNEVTLSWKRPKRGILGYEVELISERGTSLPIRLSRFETSYRFTETRPNNLYRIRVTPIMFRGMGTPYLTEFFIPECPLACPLVFSPVCGTDAQTYGNDCELEAAKCLRGDREGNRPDRLDIAYEGECDPCDFAYCEPARQCPEGFVLSDVPPPGECCLECVNECANVTCFPIICNSGFITRNFEGECCPRCAPDVFRDCADALTQGSNSSGVYTILPEGMSVPFDVYCDMETDGGGWTVILRRVNSTVDFFRLYEDYVTGFGEITGAHWIGLEKLYRLGQMGNIQLSVTMTDRMGTGRSSQYKNFQIGSMEEDYALTAASGYNGTAGNALTFNRGAGFSATDRDLDGTERNCANDLVGGWWYKTDMCTRANPLGEYMIFPNFGFEKGIFWAPFRGKQHSLSMLEMKIRL